METRVCRLFGPHDIRIETESVAGPGPGQALIRIAAGGICGSDLHYYLDGGFGPIRVREPIILGHEIAGTVEAVGAGVTELTSGDRVAVNPSRPCGTCDYCNEGLQQHCLNMRFYGSAMRFPHEQGAFRDFIVADVGQCEKVSEQTSLASAACTEPLAVCLHAAARAGSLRDKRVLVTGAGPIGSLCVAVVRWAGASEIVVTDLHDATLQAAERMGATRIVNLTSAPDAMAAFAERKGYFNVAFECSAAALALRTAIETLRPQGHLIQVGVAGDLPVPINLVVAKEIQLIGTHRFHAEFAQATELIDSGAIDVTPIITETISVDRAVEAFELARDRAKAVKVQLAFTG